MKIIGHPWIQSPQFITIISKEQIAQTQANSILLFEDIRASIKIIHYAKKEGLAFGVKISTINDALLAYNLSATYLLVEAQIALEIQNIAQHYLFDTQIIVAIKDEEEIAQYAKMGIDGVIFQQTIK